MNPKSLYCPISKTKLQPGSENLLDALNLRAENKQLSNRNGELQRSRIKDILVNNNQDIVYIIRHGIPQLIPGLSISLEGLNTGKSVD